MKPWSTAIIKGIGTTFWVVIRVKTTVDCESRYIEEKGAAVVACEHEIPRGRNDCRFKGSRAQLETRKRVDTRTIREEATQPAKIKLGRALPLIGDYKQSPTQSLPT